MFYAEIFRHDLEAHFEKNIKICSIVIFFQTFNKQNIFFRRKFTAVFLKFQITSPEVNFVKHYVSKYSITFPDIEQKRSVHQQEMFNSVVRGAIQVSNETCGVFFFEKKNLSTLLNIQRDKSAFCRKKLQEMFSKVLVTCLEEHLKEHYVFETSTYLLFIFFEYPKKSVFEASFH